MDAAFIEGLRLKLRDKTPSPTPPEPPREFKKNHHPEVQTALMDYAEIPMDQEEARHVAFNKVVRLMGVYEPISAERLAILRPRLKQARLKMPIQTCNCPFCPVYAGETRRPQSVKSLLRDASPQRPK